MYIHMHTLCYEHGQMCTFYNIYFLYHDDLNEFYDMKEKD